MTLDYTIEWASQNPQIVTGAPSDQQVRVGHQVGPYNNDHQNWILNQLHQRINELYKTPFQPFATGKIYQNSDMVTGSDNVIYIAQSLVQFKDQDPTTDTINAYWAPWLENHTFVGHIKTIAYDDGVTIDRMLRCGWVLCDGTNGTIDSDDRMLIHETNNSQAGSPSGNDDININITKTATTGASGNHTHTGTVPGHVLTSQQMPQHAHTNKVTSCDRARGESGQSLTHGTWGASNLYSGKNFSSTAGSNSAHTHPINQNSAGNHTHVATRKILGSGTGISPTHTKVYKLMFTGLPKTT